ncbi:hypothetical protein ACIGW8_26845 [Streptomyces sioyaensis]|uniref:hypothetical protein n=1 Tax=Streptomyces sioyaensis TaxID=67364 RepID=UPI0037D59216
MAASAPVVFSTCPAPRCAFFYLVVDPTKEGKETKFRVSKYDYHDCYRGSKYPKCIDD